MTKWIAGWNEPGWAHYSEPVEFDSFEEAQEELIWILECAADHTNDKELAEELRQAAIAVKVMKPGDTGVMANGQLHWITRK